MCPHATVSSQAILTVPFSNIRSFALFGAFDKCRWIDRLAGMAHDYEPLLQKDFYKSEAVGAVQFQASLSDRVERESPVSKSQNKDLERPPSN